MTLEEFGAILSRTELPVAYRSFNGDTPQLPYICYLNPYDNNFAADGKVYSAAKHIQVELYTKVKDETIEQKVKDVLSDFFYTREEEYLKEEQCWQIIFELEV